MLTRIKGAFGFMLAVERRFRRDEALTMAAALSYTSLLSLVPLLTIALAILAAFPAFGDVRGELTRTLVRMLVPEVGQQVRLVIDELIGNAVNLTAIGILGLVFTAVLLLVTIEDSLNRIFRVSRPRPPTSRILVYWTVVTLGPLLLAASMSISEWLVALSQPGPAMEPSAMTADATALFRFTMMVALFTLLYCAVPNRQIRVRCAAIGGSLAALGVAGLRVGFHIYVVDLHGYQSIYGALAVVPILLLWMYLVWVAVLAGAEITASLMERKDVKA